jgi:hypothetical protein
MSPRCSTTPPAPCTSLGPIATEDAAGFFAIKRATAKLAQHAVINDGQDLADTVLCLNYTLGDAALESLYGENVPILKSLRNNYDRTGLARAVTNICQPFRV